MPQINAVLNSVSALLLVVGYVLIRQKRVQAHKSCMITAFVTSALFLVCYLLHHYHIGGSKPFLGQGLWRPFYFYILLIPHIILAVVMLPMIGMTFYCAFTEQFDRHRRWARWTLPVWLYVSVTGVVVYVMLYEMSWASG